VPTVGVPILTPGVLPTVGTGVPGSPAIADIDGHGTLRVAIFGVIGPALLLKPDGTSSLGLATTPASQAGKRRVFAIDFAGAGFPSIPATAGSPDAPFFPAIGSPAFGDITGDGLPEFVAPTGGLRKLLDIVAPAQQGQLPDADSFVEDNVLAQHQIAAWDPRTGAVLPAFPRLMDDMQFFGSPALADVDGDGVADAINGSGAYLVRAYRADGSVPPGFPKFTHGWHIASPTAGDVDGDGKIELVATTREGKLFVWDTPAPATAAALPWAGYGRDRRHTKNTTSPVANVAAPVDPLAGLGWELESLKTAIDGLVSTLPDPDKTLLRGSIVRFLIGRTLGFIATSDEFKTSQGLGGIETGLAMTAHPIDELDPLHERFLDAVRATLVREIAATQCAPADNKCKNKVQFAQLALDFGDGFRATGSPNVAVNTWAKGIAKF
jgi:hypothetical protein